MNRVWIVGIFVALSCASLIAQENLRELLFTKSDYDAVISQTTAITLQPPRSSESEAFIFAAYAYYMKGRLLLTSYEAGRELSSLFYSCKEAKKEEGKGGVLRLFAQGVLEALRLEYMSAIDRFDAFRKKSTESSWNIRAAIWIGCLNEKLGHNAERDKAWKEVDWKVPASGWERAMVRTLLGTSATAGPPERAVTEEGRNPSLVRSVLISVPAMNQLSRAERVRLMNSLSFTTPEFFNKGKASEERYYDMLSLLAGGRCALGLSKEMFAEVDRVLSDDQKIRFAAISFLRGFSAYLLGEYDEAAKAVQQDTAARSRALLGAAVYRLGNKRRAEELWQAIETGNDHKAQSWLAYFYASVGTKLDRAEQLGRKFMEDPEELHNAPQEMYARYASVLERKAQSEQIPSKKNDLFRMVRDILNRGYSHSTETSFGKGANDPEYAVLYCSAAERVDGTHMWDVNRILSYVRQKYSSLTQLHELCTAISVCREITVGK